jgi:glycosyltransferase involved in cell wall biosynthesis
MRADLALCSRMDHRTCARCLADSPYLVPPLQRGLAAAARRAGLGRGLHRLHDLAPRTVERTLRLLRRMRPIPQVDLATAMDRRAERLREALRAVSLFLAPTRFARERALEFGIDPGRVRVAALGAVAGPTKPRPPGPRRRFGFVGSLAPHKGVHVLLEAFAGLEGDVSLDLHGSPMTHPSYADSLRRASQRDPRVRWRGPFGEGEQQRVLAGLDLLVVPSLWWENSPLTVLEALAAGVAVVASATGGVPEILADREWGTLVPPGDVAALRDALCRASGGCELAAALPPLPIKTASEGASELAVLYETAARAAS